MKTTLIVLGVVAIACLIAYLRRRIPGYRGAIGFKNQSATEIDDIQLAGFSRPIECKTLKPTEHSFNYPGRQDIPPTATVTWRLTGHADTRSAIVALDSVPTTLTDGEIFFVLRGDSSWAVEYADHLQLDRL